MKKTILAILAMLFVSLSITACGADVASGSYDNSGIVNSDLTSQDNGSSEE